MDYKKVWQELRDGMTRHYEFAKSNNKDKGQSDPWFAHWEEQSRGKEHGWEIVCAYMTDLEGEFGGEYEKCLNRFQADMSRRHENSKGKEGDFEEGMAFAFKDALLYKSDMEIKHSKGKEEEKTNANPTDGIGVSVDYGVTVPGEKCTGINLRFSYSNNAQRAYVQKLFDEAFNAYKENNRNGERAAIHPYTEGYRENKHIAGMEISQEMFDDFIKRFVVADKMKVTAGDLSIEGEYTEEMKKALGEKVAEMRQKYEETQKDDQGKSL